MNRRGYKIIIKCEKATLCSLIIFPCFLRDVLDKKASTKFLIETFPIKKPSNLSVNKKSNSHFFKSSSFVIDYFSINNLSIIKSNRRKSMKNVFSFFLI